MAQIIKCIKLLPASNASHDQKAKAAPQLKYELPPDHEGLVILARVLQIRTSKEMVALSTE